MKFPCCIYSPLHWICDIQHGLNKNIFIFSNHQFPGLMVYYDISRAIMQFIGDTIVYHWNSELVLQPTINSRYMVQTFNETWNTFHVPGRNASYAQYTTYSPSYNMINAIFFFLSSERYIDILWYGFRSWCIVRQINQNLYNPHLFTSSVLDITIFIKS